MSTHRHRADPTLVEGCPICDRRRRPGRYTCEQCAAMSNTRAFNYVRPEHMRGRAVPIHTPWVSKVREP